MSQQQQQQQNNAPQNVGFGMYGGVHGGVGLHGHAPGCGCQTCVSVQKPCPQKPCGPTSSFSSRRAEAGSYSKKVCNPQMMVYPQQQQCAPPQNQCAPQNVCQEAPNIGAEMSQQKNIGGPMMMRRSNPVISGKQNWKGGKYSLASPENRRTITIFPVINGSLAQFSQNPKSASWTLEDNLFQKTDDKGNPVGDISRGVIFGAKVKLFAENTFPVPVLVKATGLRGNVYTNSDNGVLIIPAGGILPISGDDGDIHSADPMAHSVMMDVYGNFDPDSLRSGISKMDGQNYSAVEANHIVPKIISMNMDHYGINPSKFKPTHGKFYFIRNAIIEDCIQKINEGVFKKLPFRSLAQGQFKVEISPAYGTWGDVASLYGFGGMGEDVLRRVSREQNRVSFQLSVTYSLGGKVSKSLDSASSYKET